MNSKPYMSGRKTEQSVNAHTITDIKPRLLESGMATNTDFASMSNGFKKIFTNDNDDSKMVLPIAGYGGHVRGGKSQNFYGKSHRICAIQSKKFERSQRNNYQL